MTLFVEHPNEPSYLNKDLVKFYNRYFWIVFNPLHVHSVDAMNGKCTLSNTLTDGNIIYHSFRVFPHFLPKIEFVVLPTNIARDQYQFNAPSAYRLDHIPKMIKDNIVERILKEIPRLETYIPSVPHDYLNSIFFNIPPEFEDLEYEDVEYETQVGSFSERTVIKKVTRRKDNRLSDKETNLIKEIIESIETPYIEQVKKDNEILCSTFLELIRAK